MSVRKTQRECYEVRNNGEWANITLSCWRRPHSQGTKHEGTYHCGEITIQSSFGTWGYIWTACGQPFKQFLADAEFDYVFTKFMGVKLRRYDGEGTLRQVRRDIIEQRLCGGLSRTEARDAWAAVEWESERIECDETSCGYALMEVARQLDDTHPMRDYFADPSGWPRETKYDAQAVHFWREIWPEFVGALQQEEAVA